MKKRLLTVITTIVIAMAFVPVLPASFCVESNAAASTYTGGFPAMPTAAETIAGEARRIALPYGSTNTYDHGKYDVVTAYSDNLPTAEFKAAFDTVYPDHWSWGSTTYGYATRVGASCDVFAGTVIRSCGYDKDMPRGLTNDVTYLPSKTDLWTQMAYPSSTSGMQAGDVLIYYETTTGRGHIYIYVGDGRICDAALAKRYGAQRTISTAYLTNTSNTKMLFRPIGNGRGYWQKGDKSDQVKLIQGFLNWAGFSCGTADGAYGNNTVNAVAQFQAAVGLPQTGTYDNDTLNAAKAYKSDGTYASNSPAATAPAKSAFTGKMPTKSVSYHKGTKTNIKCWQAYLKWYGYSVKVDGKFGAKTRTLTKTFQKANGLKADGKVGAKTRAKAMSVTK